jgi:hypothetical protein
MATPGDLLSQISDQLGDLPDRLAAAMNAFSAPPMESLTHSPGRVPLPMTGEQQSQQIVSPFVPAPTAFPMLSAPTAMPIPSQTLPTPSTIPETHPENIIPPMLLSSLPRATGIPAQGSPFAENSAWIHGTSQTAAAAGEPQDESEGLPRIIELLEEISSKLDRLKPSESTPGLQPSWQASFKGVQHEWPPSDREYSKASPSFGRRRRHVEEDDDDE